MHSPNTQLNSHAHSQANWEKYSIRAFAIGACMLSLACSSPEPAVEQQPASSHSVTDAAFGSTASGEEVRLYTLMNSKGQEAKITNYGGIVVSLEVPDREGKLGDVMLGYDNLADYIKDTPYFGALIGRYGNRIAKGKFSLGGKTYELATNDGPNALHGGLKGFDKVVWNAEPLGGGEDSAGLVLTYVSQDGEEGYPGTLSVKVTYRWTNDSELRIDYEAMTDKPTVLNLTNHAYFNLKDGGASSILDHALMIQADGFTPIDETLIPTGEIRPVEGTPFDFRQATAIGARIGDDNEQLKFGLGYDHNFVVNRTDDGLVLAARVSEPTTGRVLEALTTEPGIQLYTGNFLDGHLVGKGGTAYAHRSAFCLETQHFPDSPNQRDFPSTALLPGETYSTTTVYRFTAM